MNNMDRAYLAGIIDGEGCICISKNHPVDKRGKIHRTHIQYNLELVITNTDIRLIRWLTTNGGGKRITKANRYPGKWKTVRYWRTVSRPHTKEVLLLALPFLKLKHRQAKLALEFIELGSQSCPPKREKLYQKMRLLNA